MRYIPATPMPATRRGHGFDSAAFTGAHARACADAAADRGILPVGVAFIRAAAAIWRRLSHKGLRIAGIAIASRSAREEPATAVTTAA
jgi:hypothetical protein